MLNTVFQVFFILSPWLIPTALFVLIGTWLMENTLLGDIVLNLLHRLSK